MIQENAFEQKKKKPGLRVSANRPSINWALQKNNFSFRSYAN